MYTYDTYPDKTPGSEKPARIELVNGDEYYVAHHFISEREMYIAAYERTREHGIDYRFPLASIAVIDTNDIDPRLTEDYVWIGSNAYEIIRVEDGTVTVSHSHLGVETVEIDNIDSCMQCGQATVDGLHCDPCTSVIEADAKNDFTSIEPVKSEIEPPTLMFNASNPPVFDERGDE